MHCNKENKIKPFASPALALNLGEAELEDFFVFVKHGSLQQRHLGINAILLVVVLHPEMQSFAPLVHIVPRQLL